MCGQNKQCAGCKADHQAQAGIRTEAKKANPEFSNCCGQPTFNNAVGMTALEPIAAKGVEVSNRIQTISAPVITPTTPTTTPTKSTSEKVSGWLSTATNVLGLLGKSNTTDTTATYVPEEDPKKVPTAVWVVLGGLVLLIIVFVGIKVSKR
jgi:hypothetical protein